MTTTTVIFRQWRAKRDRYYGNGIIALFPYEPADSDGLMCESYEHTGQHGGADLAGVIARTRPAAPADYAALKRELESPPYDYKLATVQRTPHRAADVRRLVLERDGKYGIQTSDPDHTERTLRLAGLCNHQTGYGLPWMTYCGLPKPCPEHPGNDTY